MPEGKYWPTEEDKSPLSTRFWVPMNNPEAVAPIVVTETTQQIDDRLRNNFPVYRIARALGFSAVTERAN